MRRLFERNCVPISVDYLLSDKATGSDGLSNRMLQLGGDQFINLLFLHLSDIWRESIYPDQWASVVITGPFIKILLHNHSVNIK